MLSRHLPSTDARRGEAEGDGYPIFLMYGNPWVSWKGELVYLPSRILLAVTL